MPEEAGAGVEYLIGAGGFIDKVLRVLTQCVAQAITFLLAVFPPVRFGHLIHHAQPCIPVDIAFQPPAIERR